MGKSKIGADGSAPCKALEARHRLPTISEADLERYGTDLLALDGWRSLKTDPVSRREWGKGFGEKGMADRLYLRYHPMPEASRNYLTKMEFMVGCRAAEVMWIEWKRFGGRAKSHQLKWIACERLLGAFVLLAGVDFPATPEGFFAWYRESGLMRRNIC